MPERMRFDLTVNQFTRDVFYNKKLEIFGQNTWRPYCHVKDVARAILISFKCKNKINIFNVGNSKQNFSKRKIIDSINKYRKLKNVTFVKDKIDDKRDYKVNFNKINYKLNFKTKYTVDYGIKEILKFLIKNKKKNFYASKFSYT